MVIIKKFISSNHRPIVVASLLLLVSNSVFSAPKAKTISYWNTSNEQSTKSIDHSVWQDILDQYLDISHESGISRVDYKALKANSAKKLGGYLEFLANQTPTDLNKKEQKAYWLNLYNAALVYIATANYPFDSMNELNPWKIKFITIEEQGITLNKIMHGILRPIFNDNRVHYGMACGGLSCANVPATVFTGNNVDKQLKELGSSFVNHPRGVKAGKQRMFLNKLFDWYIDDFGGSKEALVEYIKFFAEPELKQKFEENSRIEYMEYDWKLNQP